MSLKFTVELCVVTMKNDIKIEEELTCQFKINMRNLTNFDPSTRWDSFIQSRKCMSLKLTGELVVMTMKKDAKLEEELTCPFKVDMTSLMSFDPSTQKSQKFAL